MRTERVDEVLLRNYLLGYLSDEEQAQVEDRAFADADYLGALETAEADLIDSYVRGELSQSDRRQFEWRFLTSPQRRSKVVFARTLARVAPDSMVSPLLVSKPLSVWQALVSLVRGWSPGLQLAARTAVLICVSGVWWLVVQNAGMRSRLADLETQRRDVESREKSLRQQLGEERARADRLVAQLPKQPTPDVTRAPVVASLVFLPGLSRAETRVHQLVLSSSAQLAHIEIHLEPRDEYPRFRAEVHTRRGDEVLLQGNLHSRRIAGGFVVAFDVPSTALAAGEYELSLKGMADGPPTDIGYYYFRVQRQ